MRKDKKIEIGCDLNGMILRDIGYDSNDVWRFSEMAFFECSLEELMKKLQLLSKRLKKHGYHKAVVDFRHDYDGDTIPSFEIFRMETDEEFKKRQARRKQQRAAGKIAAKKRAVKQKETDKKKFEELKKKYGWK